MAKLKDIRHPLPVTAAEWEEKVLKAPVPVIVDFWASWCAPCHMIAAHLNRIAEEYSGRLIVYKVNTDENPELAMQYGIQGIPTVLFMHNGEVVNQIIGAVPYQVFQRKTEELLATAPQVTPEVAEIEL